MLTNLGEWASAHTASRTQRRGASPTDIFVVTDWPERVWTVLDRNGRGPGECSVLGWIYRLNTDFEVTTAGDPVLVVRLLSFEDALTFLKVDAAAARPAPAPARGAC
jgi:hypothetical protein